MTERRYLTFVVFAKSVWCYVLVPAEGPRIVAF